MSGSERAQEVIVRAPFGGLELARIPRPSSEETEAVIERAVRVFPDGFQARHAMLGLDDQLDPQDDGARGNVLG